MRNRIPSTNGTSQIMVLAALSLIHVPQKIPIFLLMYRFQLIGGSGKR